MFYLRSFVMRMIGLARSSVSSLRRLRFFEELSIFVSEMIRSDSYGGFASMDRRSSLVIRL
jgi:hypothetical protein